MKKNKHILLYCLILIDIICAIILILFPAQEKNNFFHIDESKKQYVLNYKDEFIEEFISKVDYMNAISVLMNNNDHQKKCYVKLFLLDSKNKIVSEKRINSQDVFDGEYQELIFKQQAKSKNTIYKLKIYNGCDDNISLWFYDNDNENLLYNNTKTKKSIYFIENGLKKTYTYLWYPIMVLLICSLIITMDKKGDL